MSSLGDRMAKSTGWTIGMRFCDRLIGFVSILILARLLVPADFGLVAMAMTIVALLEMLTAFGFEWAIIQRQSKDRGLLDTAWTLNVIIGVVNASALLVAIPLITAFFDEPRLGAIAMVLSLSLLLSGFRNVGMVLYESDLAFGRIFALTLARRLTGFAVTLTVALLTRSYWALVLGSLAAAMVDLAMSYLLSSYRPRFALKAWREIMTFSRWLYVANAVNFAKTRGTQLIIGRLAGASTLGTFNVAYEIGSLPTSEVIGPTFRAMFPAYAKVRDDPQQLRSMFRAVVGLTMLAVAPAAVGIIVLSTPIVEVLLGDKWLAAIPLLQVFGLLGAIHAFEAPANAVNLGIGRPEIPAIIGVLHVAVSLPLFAILLASAGIVDAAASLLVVGFLSATAALTVTSRLIGFRVSSLAADVWRPLLGAAIMGLLVAIAADAVWPGVGDAWSARFAALLGLITLGVIAYFTTVAVLWSASGFPEGAESRIWSLVGRFRSRKKVQPLVDGT